MPAEIRRERRCPQCGRGGLEVETDGDHRHWTGRVALVDHSKDPPPYIGADHCPDCEADLDDGTALVPEPVECMTDTELAGLRTLLARWPEGVVDRDQLEALQAMRQHVDRERARRGLSRPQHQPEQAR